MQQKRVHVVLPPDSYERLVRIAEHEERVVDQQAAYILKRAIAAHPDPDTPPFVRAEAVSR